MEGLLRRISEEGSEAENALRVVAFFDRLVEHRSSPHALVRSAARLIGAPAGYLGRAGGASWSFDSLGRPMGASVPPGARTQEIQLERGSGGLVWILPETSNYALADLVLERMALSASIIIGRDAGAGVLAESATLARLLDRNSPAEDRAAYAHALGFRPTWRVRVVVARPDDMTTAFPDALRKWARAHGIKCAAPIADEEVWVALFQDFDEFSISELADWPAVVAVGSRVSLESAQESLAHARQALRLCSRGLGPTALEYESLGPLRYLAAVDPEVAAADPMVQALDALCRSETGMAEVKALDAFCRHTSLRSAAAELNLHHSSLANRLDNVSRKLNIDLADAQVRISISMALWLLRVRMSLG